MDENKHLAPAWIIYADGRRLDTAHEGALRSITVTDRLNGVSEFAAVFDTAETKVREQGLLAFGSEVSIHLGYKDDMGEVFRGEALRFHGTYAEGRSERLEASGSGLLHRLRRGARYRGYEGKKPSEAIKGILEGCSLKAEVEEFGAAREFQSEEGQTDYEYLMEQAGLYGKQVHGEGDTVYVKGEVATHKDEIIYELGKGLVFFEAAQDIEGLASGVDYVGWDSKKDEGFTGKAELADLAVKVGGGSDWTAAGKGAQGAETQADMDSKDSDEAGQLALGRLQRDSYRYGQARGRGEGNHKLRAGMRVTIKGVGEDFEGEYMAEEVTHRADRGGYSTEFALKRNMGA
jgi:phage protein D